MTDSEWMRIIQANPSCAYVIISLIRLNTHAISSFGDEVGANFADRTPFDRRPSPVDPAVVSLRHTGRLEKTVHGARWMTGEKPLTAGDLR